MSGDKFQAAKETKEVGDVPGPRVGSVKTSEIIAVIILHVVAEKVLGLAASVLENISPVETIIFCEPLPEPGSARRLSHTAKVALRINFIQHF